MLKNSFGVFALKTRRARMPYKRRSPARYTFLVTRFGAVLHLKGVFQQPQALSPVILHRERFAGLLVIRGVGVEKVTLISR